MKFSSKISWYLSVSTSTSSCCSARTLQASFQCCWSISSRSMWCFWVSTGVGCSLRGYELSRSALGAEQLFSLFHLSKDKKKEIKLEQSGWNVVETSRDRNCKNENVSPWKDRRGSAGVIPGLSSVMVTTVCECSKKFSPYCPSATPVKLSSTCEACFIPLVGLQSNCAISTHRWHTVKRESNGQFVERTHQVTIPCKQKSLVFFLNHPSIWLLVMPQQFSYILVCLHQKI